MGQGSLPYGAPNPTQAPEGARGGYAFGATHVQEEIYEFSVLSEIKLPGTMEFPANLNVGYSVELEFSFLDETALLSQEIAASRAGLTLENMSAQGINYMYIAAAAVDKFEGIILEDQASTTVVYGAYSYNLSAPTISYVGISYTSAASQAAAAMFGNDDSWEGTKWVYSCEYDGAEMATYDAKFGAINNSGSVETIINSYMTSIAEESVEAQLTDWYNNDIISTTAITLLASNFQVNPMVGTFARQITGSVSVSDGRGGSTGGSGGAMSSMGGGGGSGY